MGPPEHRKSRPPSKAAATTKEMSKAEPTADAATTSKLDKLETRVSLLADGGDFNRSIWWPGRIKCKRWINSKLITKTTLIRASEELQTGERTKRRTSKDKQTQTKTATTTTISRENKSNPMISINVSEPPSTFPIDEQQQQPVTIREPEHEIGEAETKIDGGGGGGEGDDFGREDNDQQSGSDSLVCNVENVRHNFIRLISYNKFLYFYLATLIYSVINLGLILYYLTNPSRAQPVKNYQHDFDHESCSNLIIQSHHHHHHHHQLLLLIDKNLFRLVKWFLVPAICILVMVILMITVEFNSSQHNHTTHKSSKSREMKRIISRSCHTIGRLVTLILLNLPFVLFLIHQITISGGSTGTDTSHKISNDSSEQQLKDLCDDYDTPPPTTTTTTTNHNRYSYRKDDESQLSLAALLGALYLQPLFIGSSRGLILNAKIICLLQVSSQLLSVLWFGRSEIDLYDKMIASIIIYSRRGGGRPSVLDSSVANSTEAKQRHLEAIDYDSLGKPTMIDWQWVILMGCLTLLPAIIFGALRRRRFRHSISRDTFLGAGDLIEAKVSLEHQRQQQETLLLSVLPAYVAEQVKRTMLKKTNNGTDPQAAWLVDQQTPASQALITPQSPLQRYPVGGGHLNSPIGSASQQQQQQQQQQQPESSATFISHSNSTGFISQRPASLINNKFTTVTEQQGKQQQQQQQQQKSLQNSSIMKKLESSVSLQPQRLQPEERKSGNSYHPPARSASQVSSSVGQMGQVGSNNTSTNLVLGAGIVATSSIGSQQLGTGVRRGFNELYIRTYNNVSLLYGDIVGFTRLCTQLSSSQLVRVLNDLFSHFDHLAEKHKIMRIKILGDCYYGVSGIPEFAVMGAKSRAQRNENHAINCVNMGLDMISYIKCLNVEAEQNKRRSEMLRHSASGQVSATSQQQQQQQQHHHQSSTSTGSGRKSSSCSINGSKSAETFTALQQEQQQQQQHQKSQDIQSPLPVFELNMRIGVHSGHIHSGVIGLKKWQFDVWSNDVSIAMHCESSGTAGRVQVTEATIQQLNGAFSYEEARASERDSFLATKGIKTFLIRDRIKVSRQHQHQLSDLSLAGGVAMSMAASPLVMSQLQSPTSDAIMAGDIEQSESHVQRANKRQQQRQRMLKNSMEKAEKDLMLDEDKIRAATIGTIRQTLMAGESCNSSGCNSIGLALDHNDLKPMCLDFRDPILGKLYKNRLAHSLVHESVAVLLLLLIVLPLIDYLLLLILQSENVVDPSVGRQKLEELDDGEGFSLSSSTILIGISTVCSFLLVIGGIWSRIRDRNCKLISQHHSGKQTGTPPNRSVRSRRRSTIEDDSIISIAIPTTTTTTNDNYHVVVDDSISKNKRKTLCAQIRNHLHHCCNSISKSKYNPIGSSTTSSSMRRTSKFRSFTIVLIFFIVIMLQNYLIFKSKNCAAIMAAQYNTGNRMSMMDDGNKNPEDDTTKSNNNNNNNNIKGFNIISIEPHHVAVIFVLICLDSSVNSIGYQSKLVIVIIVICMNILYTFRVNPLLPDFLLKHFIKQSSKIFCQQQRGESNQLQQEAADFVMPDNGYKPQESRQQQQQQVSELDSMQALIDWSTSALMILVALLSLAYARQLEYTNRANFLWRNRLGVDHEELEYISGINKVLLENILPSHVVEHYMSHPSEHTQQPQDHQFDSNKVAKLQNYMRMSFSNMRNSSNELYHEQHESVAVMFASIPHFYEFYDESDISKQGLGCIALLNEIICDFDKLLLKNKFSRIEKIKTIGSTYMAAAGLRPSYGGRNSTVSAQTLASIGQHPVGFQQQQPIEPNNTLTINMQPATMTTTATSTSSNQEDQQVIQGSRKPAMSQEKLNLICMIQFASSLMSALNGINKQSFQGFKLRVGVNSGSVIAGIIGAQRPFYDIWGDCVNIASRMDSLGETGRIQVEEKTAQLLMESLCPETYSIVRRGPIEVKGKGGMVTYFVDRRQPAHQQQQTNTQRPQQRMSGAPSSGVDAGDGGVGIDITSVATIGGGSHKETDVHRLTSTQSGSLVGSRITSATNTDGSSELANEKQVEAGQAQVISVSTGGELRLVSSSSSSRKPSRSNSLGFTC